MVWNDIVQNQYEDMVRQQENEVQDMVRQMFFSKFASLAKHMQSGHVGNRIFSYFIYVFRSSQ